MDYTIEQLIDNLQMPQLEVRHQDLTRSNTESCFRSICPECKEEGLFVQRDTTTFELLLTDFCSHCLRRFVYTDIKPGSMILEYI
jgi:hypothetical protein